MKMFLEDGPYDGQALEVAADKGKEAIGLPVDEHGFPTRQTTPFGLAIYGRIDDPQVIKYKFRQIKPRTKELYSVEFVGGPAAGILPAQQPAQYLTLQQPIPLLADGSQYRGSGVIDSIALYERREHGGEQRFEFLRIERDPEQVDAFNRKENDRRLSEALRNFYTSPDYNIYSMKPTGEHVQVPVEVGFRRGHVDEQMASLIEAVWKMGLDTLGSCQQRPEGGKHAGKAYIGFPRRDDARRFETVLRNAGIDCIVHEKEMRIARKLDDGTVAETFSFDSANVLFEPSDIGRATEATRLAFPL